MPEVVPALSPAIRQLTGDASAAAFPLGGIGTGNVSIGARGELRDWELMNYPDKGRSLPFTFFAIRAATDGEDAVTRVLESRLRPPHQFDQGYAAARVAGLPRFRESHMRGQYPLLEMTFEDETMPVDVELTAFTPLVPLNVDASSIPAAILRYRVTNPQSRPVNVTIAGSISNPVGLVRDSDLYMPAFDGHPNIQWRDIAGLRGLHCTTDLDPHHLSFGSVSLLTRDEHVTSKPQWLVGFWNDGVQRFWDDLREDGRLEPEAHFSLDTTPGGFLAMEKPTLTDSELAERLTRLRTGSLAITHELAPGESREFEFVLSWSFPNRPRGWRGGVINDDAHGDEILLNHYATRFPDSWSAADHLTENLASLEGLTRNFVSSLYSGTVPEAVADAAGANIATLRSTTCFILEDGTFAAWEGSFDHAGSCEGTCTHVWNYAQTAAFLFPSLERSAREVELLLETDEFGLMQFRTNRLFGSPSWKMLPAVDGQLGTIIRVYREWLFSGDDSFLERVWPGVIRAVEFAFRYWDTDGDGVLDGQQHNTYDIEFYGPDPLGNTLFFAALHSAASLAAHLGDHDRSADYLERARAGAERMDEMLFNGEYYEQASENIDRHRYQYGAGVLSDQLFGQLLAHVVGLGHILPAGHVRSAIEAVYRHNFRPSLREHNSVQRSYALGDEGGLLLCSWPRGGRPKIPFIYSDEVWTGVEYQVAAHLIYEGFVDEGISVVTALRQRHNGVNRNPWNEPECGNHYARSLASWSVLLALAGFGYDAVSRALRLDPAQSGDFAAFFSTGSGWGSIEITADHVAITLHYGRLDLDEITLAGKRLVLRNGGIRIAAGGSIRVGR